MSQEQEPDQQEPPAGKVSRSKDTQERALVHDRSIWPFALACALMVMLMGFITQPLIFTIGVLLVIVAVIGWGLERR